nr:uncharacterized protein LOC104001207 [Pan troglodytes]
MAATKERRRRLRGAGAAAGALGQSEGAVKSRVGVRPAPANQRCPPRARSFRWARDPAPAVGEGRPLEALARSGGARERGPLRRSPCDTLLQIGKLQIGKVEGGDAVLRWSSAFSLPQSPGRSAMEKWGARRVSGPPLPFRLLRPRLPLAESKYGSVCSFCNKGWAGRVSLGMGTASPGSRGGEPPGPPRESLVSLRTQGTHLGLERRNDVDLKAKPMLRTFQNGLLSAPLTGSSGFGGPVGQPWGVIGEKLTGLMAGDR